MVKDPGRDVLARVHGDKIRPAEMRQPDRADVHAGEANPGMLERQIATVQTVSAAARGEATEPQTAPETTRGIVQETVQTILAIANQEIEPGQVSEIALVTIRGVAQDAAAETVPETAQGPTPAIVVAETKAVVVRAEAVIVAPSVARSMAIVSLSITRH